MAGVAQNNNPADRNTEATVHVGQLDPRVTDQQLWELMVQAGPVKHVYIPRDRITGNHHGYGFCEFMTELDAAYASKVLNMTTLYSKSIRLAQSSTDRHAHDVGANLFVGNLAPSVDEKLLYEAFSAFGTIVDAPHVMRDPDTNTSKGYGFVKFANFAASDKAVETMNGQYVCNQPLVVQYAFKKEGDGRERHGSEAERTLAAASARASTTSVANTLVPHTLFADRPASAVPQPPPPQVAAHGQYGAPPAYHPYGNPVPVAGRPPVAYPTHAASVQYPPYQRPGTYFQQPRAQVYAAGNHAMPQHTTPRYDPRVYQHPPQPGYLGVGTNGFSSQQSFPSQGNPMAMPSSGTMPGYHARAPQVRPPPPPPAG